MPKPGKWMGTVKLIFALLILLTCLWLISLLSSFIGIIYTAAIAALMIIIFAILIWKKHGKRVFLVSLLSLLVVVSLAFVTNHFTAKHGVDPLHDETQWVPLDAKLIKQEVAKGYVVFVDVTAKWCVTCKANKIGVLLQDPVSSELQKQDVVAMSGDWTVRSDDVTAYLQSFGRYGVPFNIVYGPGAPNGIELSTILNSDDVMKAIEQAKGQ